MSFKPDQKQEFRELADWVIDRTKKAGARDCKVSISKRRFVEINYRERKPESIKEATTQSIYLEVFINNRYAGQSTPDFRKSTLETFIADVISNAKIVEEDPYRTLPDPKYYAGAVKTDLQLADAGHEQLTPEERHAIVKSTENACLRQGGEKVISVEAGEYDHFYEEYVKSSNGFEGSTQTTEYWVSAGMTARDEGDRKPSAGSWVGCRFRNDLPPVEQIGKTAALRTLDLLGGRKLPTETMPVIIENRVASNVLYGFMSALTGRSVQQKRSFLIDKKGQQIGSKVFTLTDEPLIPKALGSRYYDGDGFPSKRLEIIREGMLNEYLVDWYYSRKLGWEPTTGWPGNLILPPGKRSVDEIIKDLGRCILITDFIGGNSNSTTGDFSIGIIGKLFDKGQLVNAVAEMNVADNHLNFWNKLAEAGNDPWKYDTMQLPSLVFNNVVVSGI